ncbi:hypothetical protein H6P81_002665 [Aristolochia fimbriata]|uniref:Uncharacterized protein n=1 Tax=Aristolochia fimbriata TaxID=158543 RepID=A0AAV7FDL6_ARIFI|nr:hypothetical protein H6P81_002665 [Aristolochia fimbriata]
MYTSLDSLNRNPLRFRDEEEDEVDAHEGDEPKKHESFPGSSNSLGEREESLGVDDQAVATIPPHMPLKRNG